MLRSLFVILLVLSVTPPGKVLAQVQVQVQDEDVVILKDSTIIRGEITQAVTQGSAVTVRRANGRVTSLLWSEIFTIKRLPVSMPDSAIAALYLRSGSGGKPPSGGASTISGGYSSPFGVAARDTTVEDILILADGRMVRGTLVESSQSGTVGLWSPDRKLSIYRNSEIQKKLHLEKGTTDSTIDVMYVHPLPEMIADNFRILTIFGGFSLAAGEFANPSNDGVDPGGSGYAVGLHVSLRIVPTIRWATSIIYGRNSTGLPKMVSENSGTGSPDPSQLIWALTGAELRTEGTAMMKAFAFAQGGLLFSKITGFDFAIPGTVRTASATGSQGGGSSSGFAFSIGGGFGVGRFSLTGRWLTSTVSYSYYTTVDYGPFYGPARAYPLKFDQPVSVILVSIGFSPF